MNKLTVRQILKNMNWMCLFIYIMNAITSFAMCRWECGMALTCASLMTILLMLEERRGELEKEEFAIILFRFALVYLEKLRKESGDKPNEKDKE